MIQYGVPASSPQPTSCTAWLRAVKLQVPNTPEIEIKIEIGIEIEIEIQSVQLKLLNTPRGAYLI